MMELLAADNLLQKRLVYILVDNAIKYTLPGGSVEVDLKRREDSAVLVVTDINRLA